MWCSHCQQDVPAVANAADTASICCARCGQSRSSGAIERGGGSAEPVTVASESADEPIDFVELTDWELDRQCQRVDRITGSLQVVIPRPCTDEKTTGPNLHRFDGTPHRTPHRHVMPHRADRRRSRLQTWCAWAAWSVGMMAFVCGGIVLAVAVIQSRPELWSTGLPLVLFGQALLLFGIILQLDRLSHADRQTQQALGRLDEQIVEIQHAATLLGITHSAPGQSFYLHLAQGAPPQALLADLKGQLDLLANQLAESAK